MDPEMSKLRTYPWMLMVRIHPSGPTYVWSTTVISRDRNNGVQE